MTNVYEEIGPAFLNALCASQSLGHVSPAGLADYVNPDDLPAPAKLILAAFASTRLDSHGEWGREMVRQWVHDTEFGRETFMACAEASA